MTDNIEVQASSMEGQGCSDSARTMLWSAADTVIGGPTSSDVVRRTTWICMASPLITAPLNAEITDVCCELL